MSDPISKQGTVVYMVADQSGDDMCGGLNLHGIFTSEDAAQTHLDEIESEGWFLEAAVYPIPLNIPGWFGYGMDKFESSDANEKEDDDE